MKQTAMLFGLIISAAIAAGAADPSTAATSTLLNEVRAACQADAQKLCAGVQSGGGRILSCLEQHTDALSDACNRALVKLTQAQN